MMLETPNFKTKYYGQRLFEYNGSRLWALPMNIKVEEEMEQYRKKVKTLLFADIGKCKVLSSTIHDGG